MAVALQALRVLVADDDEPDRNYIAGKITSWGFQVETAADGVDALEKSAVFQPRVIVSDVRMPRMDGYELIQRLREHSNAPPPVILLTQFGTIETAVSAVHEAGAFWFLEKPVPAEPLQALISRALEHTKLSEENERLRNLIRRDRVGELVGNHPRMQELFEVIRRVAPSTATVLITGESGTGKEMVARAIHASSPRHNAPFIALNCAALPETLIESELFGHEKGAFTGASDRQLGRLELAQGGTLFLDEIGELPVTMQAKLLRVLEDSRVRRLGGKAEVQLDVRIIAATNRPPDLAIKEGKLREDLFYRLSVFQLEIPPLRERLEDIPLLATALLASLEQKHDRSMKSLAPGVVERLKSYDWPGNVRELRNVLERAMILAGEEPISLTHLPENLSHRPAATPAPSRDGNNHLSMPLGVSMRDAERALILATFEFAGGSRRKTAEILGLSLKTVQTRLREFRRAAVETPEKTVASVRNGSGFAAAAR